ncbi:MAG: hypothetical protein J6Q13_00970 [Clostridia bacterium]|nr:hypothetical protein [Clostridia bacterium]
MDELEKQLIVQKLKIKRRIERIKLDNEILSAIEEDLNRNDFNKLFTISSKFIYQNYAKLWQIVIQANCPDNEKLKAMHFLNDKHRKFREEMKEKNGFEL